jgi:hypothetical protein
MLSIISGILCSQPSFDYATQPNSSEDPLGFVKYNNFTIIYSSNRISGSPNGQRQRVIGLNNDKSIKFDKVSYSGLTYGIIQYTPTYDKGMLTLSHIWLCTGPQYGYLFSKLTRIDSSGNVVTGSAGGGGVSIDPYLNVGTTGTTFTWNVSGASTNYEVTLSANTRFVIQNPGVYSLAFSAQMLKTGGNSSTHAHIWLYQNGLDVPYSASQIGFPSNSVYVVPAWNFFFSTTTPNEYVELKWEINSNVDNQLLLKHQPATGNVPVIPSLIVTINQVN